MYVYIYIYLYRLWSCFNNFVKSQYLQVQLKVTSSQGQFWNKTRGPDRDIFHYQENDNCLRVIKPKLLTVSVMSLQTNVETNTVHQLEMSSLQALSPKDPGTLESTTPQEGLFQGTDHVTQTQIKSGNWKGHSPPPTPPKKIVPGESCFGWNVP